MTPKSLLRHKRCISKISEFTSNSSFHRILEDDAFSKRNKLISLKNDKKIKKVVMCSGKIYYDLVEAREKSKKDDVVFIRLEQLYPFPAKTLANILKRFTNAKFLWCQEEPKNMGAWNTVRNYIQWSLNYIKADDKEIKYIGRKPAASPASGYLKKHLAEQNEILEKVVGKF